MKVQTRALQISFLIHTLFILGVLGLSGLMASRTGPLVIDFSLEKPVPADSLSRPRPAGEKAQAQPAPKHSATAPEQRVPLRAETTRPTEKGPTVLHSTSELTVPVEGTEPKEMEPGQGLESRTIGVGLTGGSRTDTGPGGGGSGAGTGGEGLDQARTKYLQEHFSYIREKIFRNLSYPPPARRQGWQGKVMLSFLIEKDGSVKSTRLIQSSGFELLDRSALEAVKKSAPFPAPPAEAQIIIPITYQLN